MNTSNSDGERSDDDKDFDGNRVSTTSVININLVKQLGKCGAYSRHSVQFPLDMPIGDLKKDIQPVVKIASESQMWLYMNRELNNSDTLRSIRILNQAIIEVKRICKE
ncbi:hypothetical protein BsWGS_12425 [Bradybaena similaris]